MERTQTFLSTSQNTLNICHIHGLYMSEVTPDICRIHLLPNICHIHRLYMYEVVTLYHEHIIYIIFQNVYRSYSRMYQTKQKKPSRKFASARQVCVVGHPKLHLECITHKTYMHAWMHAWMHANCHHAM